MTAKALVDMVKIIKLAPGVPRRRVDKDAGPLVALGSSPFAAQDELPDTMLVGRYRLVRGPHGALVGLWRR